MNDLRRSIAYVTQEPVLICGTIRENMQYANKEAKEIEMKKALARVDAMDFVQ